jgi:hypothetical protein
MGSNVSLSRGTYQRGSVWSINAGWSDILFETLLCGSLAFFTHGPSRAAT